MYCPSLRDAYGVDQAHGLCFSVPKEIPPPFLKNIFKEMREGGLDAVHVTIAYHETFRETVLNMEQWNRWFEQFPSLIFQGTTGADVRLAKETNRTAIFFGFQNPSPIEDDIGLVQILHQLGARFMQLTYTNQS